ncbi:MAG: hypothetical protein ABFS45_17685 [Pseudomonadota bacterium]
MNPSPRAHIYRLFFALIVFVAAFLGIRALAIPDSWDSERWYRTDSLGELQSLPLRYGGNESCETAGCHNPEEAARHDKKLAALALGPHRELACEVCHGPVADHVKDGKKVNEAQVTVANKLCLSCHKKLIGRPEQFAQFSETLLYHELLKVRERSLCRACHDPHEPK